METRRMGDTGPEVSLVGLGCNNFGMKLDARETAAVVSAALDVGITHLDTAEKYGGGRSEEYIGRALGSRRGEVIIATKFAPRPEGEEYRPGALRRRVLAGCEGSLRRLATDYIDLYYQHFPDAEGPVEEVLETMAELVASGKVRWVGVSNFDAAQLDEAAVAAVAAGGGRVAAPVGAGGGPTTAGSGGQTGPQDGGGGRAAASSGPTLARDRQRGLPFVACQIHWNLLNRQVEAEVVPAARRNGLGIVPYYPLASGLLTGKYRHGEAFPPGSRLAALPRFAKPATAENLAYVGRLSRFAEEHGHSLLDLAFGWLVAQEGVASVIAGATTPDQVASNVRAGQAWRLTAHEMGALPARG